MRKDHTGILIPGEDAVMIASFGGVCITYQAMKFKEWWAHRSDKGTGKNATFSNVSTLCEKSMGGAGVWVHRECHGTAVRRSSEACAADLLTKPKPQSLALVCLTS